MVSKFALVCPSEFEFLFDRWNPLPHWMPTSDEHWCLAYKWLGLWNRYFVWGFKYDSSLLQIYLEGRISKKIWIWIYFWRFTSVRVLAGWWRVFPTFFSYISPFLFLPAPETNPKQHNDGKIQQVKDNEVFHDFYFILKTFRAQT